MACMFVGSHVGAWCLWRSAEESDPLDLELYSQVTVSNHMDIKPRSMARADVLLTMDSLLQAHQYTFLYRMYSCIDKA